MSFDTKVSRQEGSNPVITDQGFVSAKLSSPQAELIFLCPPSCHWWKRGPQESKEDWIIAGGVQSNGLALVDCP